MNFSDATLEQFCTTPANVRLCYRTAGDVNHPTVILVLGLGLQLIYWPQGLIDNLVEQGYHVVWFDNRDVGQSSHLATPTPGVLDLLLRRKLDGAYDLTDMAADSIALLDHLGIPHAHWVGMSMGGMIAQTAAALYPKRCLSLTSIFSTTGARTVGQPAFSTMWKLIQPGAKTKQQAISKYLDMARHISDSGFPMDEDIAIAYAALAWERGAGADESKGTARQVAAIIKSGNRTRLIQQVRVPTLVIHGDKDPIVHPSGGLATAKAITNAQHHSIKGMGHYISEALAPQLVDTIHQHIQTTNG